MTRIVKRKIVGYYNGIAVPLPDEVVKTLKLKNKDEVCFIINNGKVEIGKVVNAK